MLIKLKKHYFKLISPAIALFLIFGASKAFNLALFEIPSTPTFFPALFFILAAITAVAAPLFLRTFFAHSMRNEKKTSTNSFLKFQKGIISISMLTPFFAFFAVAFEFNKFYSTSIVLFSFYSIYYYFPTKQRIDFDKKIFRINE